MWRDQRQSAAPASGRAIPHVSGPVGIGGWLLMFCLLLLAWQPISLALVASSALDALAVRGAPVGLVLMIRLSRQDWELRRAWRCSRAALRRPHWRRSLLAHQPGDTELVLAASLAYYASWLAYLFWSKRVRNTFGS
jgi:hypothetical protein